MTIPVAREDSERTIRCAPETAGKKLNKHKRRMENEKI
jgi:hypothetical protein